jgi:hypothetical protein
LVARIASRARSTGAAAMTGIALIACISPRLICMVLTYPHRPAAYCANLFAQNASGFLASGNQHRAFVGIRWFFPDPLVPRVKPSQCQLQRFEGVDFVMGSEAFEVESEAVVPSLRIESDSGDGNGKVGASANAAHTSRLAERSDWHVPWSNWRDRTCHPRLGRSRTDSWDAQQSRSFWHSGTLDVRGVGSGTADSVEQAIPSLACTRREC